MIDGGPLEDVGADAPLAPPPVFEAVPDPDVLTGCQTETPDTGTAMAKEVECAEELLPGSVAQGRIGDLLLQNDRVRVLVRTGTGAVSTIGAFAGGIVDAAHQGGTDLIKDLLFGLDLNSSRPSAIVVTDGGGSEPARIRVLYENAQLGLVRGVLGGSIGRVPAAFGAIDYELRPDEDFVRVTVSVAAKEGVAMVAGRPEIIALAGGASELQQPGVGVLSDDEPGETMQSFLVGESADSAYAVRILQAAGGVGHIDSIHLMAADEVIVARAGETAVWEARVGLAPTAARAHAAATEDTALDGDDTRGDLVVTGPAGDRVEVLRDDRTVLRSRFGEDGTATFRLAPGPATVRAGFGDYFEGTPMDVAVPGEVTLEAAPRATLDVDATADGETAPVRVTLELADRQVRHVAFGATSIQVPPGPVTITVSRGIEYDLVQEERTLLADETVSLSPDLIRVVDTTGWVGGDFHLHSEMSTDSLHAVPDAVRIVAAEGLEVVAATDHDSITDYRPAILDAGLEDWVLAVSGAEVSDPILAHINGYPLRRSPEASGGGAIEWFDQSPIDTFADLRGLGDPAFGDPIVQVNHPNRNGSGWFRSIGLDPVSGMATANPADLNIDPDSDLNTFDFDVIEAWNKSPDENDEITVEQLLGLWSHGWRFGMMGNSDSHEPGNPAGSPRTYISVPDDTPGNFDWTDVATSIRAARMTVSGGAFVTAEVGVAAGDSVPVSVRVQVPPWAEVDRLRIYAGTEVVLDQPIVPTGEILQVDETFDVDLGGADFILVRADGSRRASPVVDFAPYGMTNPLPLP